MSSTTRKTRNYKEKSSMLAFGHIALPLAAVIAVGLLFIGIKLFFLTPPEDDAVEITPQSSYSAQAEPTRNDPVPETVETTSQPDDDDLKAEAPAPSANDTVALARPVGGGDAAPAQQATKPKQQNTKPQTPPAKPQNAAAKESGAQKQQAQSAQPSKPQQKPQGGAASFGVQIGAFSKKEGAESVAKDAAKLGYSATISQGQNSGKTYFRVRVPAGKTRDDAARVAAELEKHGFPVAIIANP